MKVVLESTRIHSASALNGEENVIIFAFIFGIVCSKIIMINERRLLLFFFLEFNAISVYVNFCNYGIESC